MSNPMNVEVGQPVVSNLLAAVDIADKAVGSTLGPCGLNVLIRINGGQQQVTKDGVTVINSIVLPVPEQDVFMQAIRQAAGKSVTQAGDGTTTTTVIACELIRQLVAAKAKHRISTLNREVHAVVPEIVNELKRMTMEISSSDRDMLMNVAMTASNRDVNASTTVVDAVMAAGKYGVVALEKGRAPDCVVVQTKGFVLDIGYGYSGYINNAAKNAVELSGARVIVFRGHLEDNESTVRKVASLAGGVPYATVVVCEDCDESLLVKAASSYSRNKGGVLLFTAPGYGRERLAALDDLAAYVGVHVDTDLDWVVNNVHRAGRADIKVTSSLFTVTTDIPSKLTEEQINVIKHEIEDATTYHGKQLHSKRLARLNGGMVKITVGAETNIARDELYDRIDDALRSTQAAITHGVLAGGSTALVKAVNLISKEISLTFGGQLLMDALEAPFKRLLSNAGYNVREVSDLLDKVRNSDDNFTGIDIYTGEHMNMLDSGVLDASIVPICAIQNAVSVATILATVDTTICALHV